MNSKNVLVSGASTGIGRRIAEHLAATGFHVFAGARKDEDIADLSKLENVTGVRLDITQKDEIEACVKLIEKSGGVFAIVNNAGIVNSSPLLEMNEESYFFQLDVNLVAANRLLQHFFKQLRDNKGRIVNISSFRGFFTATFLGAYSISKFGLVAYSEQLRSELKKFNIQVSCVEPGYFYSAIHKKYDENLEESKKTTKYYKEEYGVDISTEIQDENIKDPKQVAERVYHSLTAESSHIHYAVGNRTEEGWIFHELFNRIIKVNEGLAEPWTFEELQEKFTSVNNGELKW